MVIETILFTSLSVMPHVINKMSHTTISPQNVLGINIEPTPTPQPTKKTKIKATKKAVSIKKQNKQSSINKEDILNALNEYRQKNGKSKLIIDEKLQNYAQNRADELKTKGKLDNHAPFYQYMKSKKAFSDLGFNNLAENQSWNHKGNATNLINQFYAKSSGHNKNQLSSEYSHVGIGISGVFTNIVFAGSKI